MLRIIQPYELRDFLRTSPGDMGYMTPVAPNNRALQWQGAYSKNISIVYFYAKKINNIGAVEASYDIDTTCIKHENGQYLVDETKLFGGILPEGYYYFEFNNGINSFFTEIFCVNNTCQLIRASSSQLSSSSQLISNSCVDNPNASTLDEIELPNPQTSQFDHSGLSNLAWANSGHTGTASKLAAFDSNGLATYADLATNDNVIIDYTVPSDVSAVDITTDKNGNTLNITEGEQIVIAIIVPSFVNVTGNTNLLGFRFNNISTNNYYYTTAVSNYIPLSNTLYYDLYSLSQLVLIEGDLVGSSSGQSKSTLVPAYQPYNTSIGTRGLSLASITQITLRTASASSLIPTGARIIVKKL